jgi:nucleotide-binding universal stress UspA family protein
MVRHILLATDGSPAADLACQRAVTLAVSQKARLTVLHVAQQELSAPATGDQATAEWSGRTAEFEARAKAAGVRRVQGMVTSGLAYSRILQTAERLDIDLIVLGAIGSSASAGLGEVASHVVKFANCSVLIVR